MTYAGGQTVLLSPLSRLMAVPDPNQPLGAAVLGMIQEHNAAASFASDPGPVLPVSLATAPGTAAPPVAAQPEQLYDYELNPQASGRAPKPGVVENLLVLLRQKPGTEDYRQMAFDVVYDPAQLEVVLPQGSGFFCRPHPTLVRVLSARVDRPGRLSVALESLSASRHIYGQAHQLCTLSFKPLTDQKAEVRVEHFVLNGGELGAEQFASRPGGFGITPSKPPPAPTPVAALSGSAPAGEKLTATADTTKADVVLGFSKQEIRLGVGGVEEVIVSVKKFPSGEGVGGVGLKMNFDPRAVKLVDRGGVLADKVLVNPVYDLVLGNTIDNNAGTLEVNVVPLSFGVVIPAPVELFRFYVRGETLTPVGAIRINPNEVVMPGLAASRTVAVEPLNVLVTQGGTKSSVAGSQGFRITGKKEVTFGTATYDVAPETKTVTFATGPRSAEPDQNFDYLADKGYLNPIASSEALVISGGETLPRGRSRTRDGGGFVVEGGDWDITSVRGLSGSATTDANVQTFLSVIAWRDPAALRGKELVLTYKQRTQSPTAQTAFGVVGASIRQSTNLAISGGVGGKAQVEGQVTENPGTQAVTRIKLTTRPAVFEFGDVNFTMPGGAYTNLPLRQGEGMQMSLRPGGSLRDKLTLDAVLMKARSEQAISPEIQGNLTNPKGPFPFAANQPVVPGSVQVNIDGEPVPASDFEVDYGRGEFTLIGRKLEPHQKARVVYEKSSLLFFTGGVTGWRMGYKPSPKFGVNLTRLESQASQADSDPTLTANETALRVCRQGIVNDPCGSEVGENQFRTARARVDVRKPEDILITFKNTLADAAVLGQLTASGAITEGEHQLLSQPGALFTLTFGKDVFFKTPQDQYKGVWSLAEDSLLARIGGRGEVTVLYPFFNPTYVQEQEIVIASYDGRTDIPLPSDAFPGSEEVWVGELYQLEPTGRPNSLNEYTLENKPQPTIVLQGGTRLRNGDRLRITYDSVPLFSGVGGTFDKIVQGFDFRYAPNSKLTITGETAESTGDLGEITTPITDRIENFDTVCRNLTCKLSNKPVFGVDPVVEIVKPDGNAVRITVFTVDYAASTISLGRSESQHPYQSLNVLEAGLAKPTVRLTNEPMDMSLCRDYNVPGKPYNYRCFLPFGNVVNEGNLVLTEQTDAGPVVLTTDRYELFAQAGVVLLSRSQALPMLATFDYVPTHLVLRVAYTVATGAARTGEIAKGRVSTVTVGYKEKKWDYALNTTRRDRTFLEFSSNTKGVGAADTTNENHTLNLRPVKGMDVALKLTENRSEPIGAAGSHNAVQDLSVNFPRGAVKTFRFGRNRTRNEVLAAAGGAVGQGAQNTETTKDFLNLAYAVRNRDRLKLSLDYESTDTSNEALSNSLAIGAGKVKTGLLKKTTSLRADYKLNARGALGTRLTHAYEGSGYGYDLNYSLLKNGRANFTSNYDNSRNSVVMGNRFTLLPTRDLRFDVNLSRNQNRALTGLASRNDTVTVDISKARWGPLVLPKLVISRRTDPNVVQGGQRTETFALDTSVRLLRQIDIRPHFDQNSTTDALKDSSSRKRSVSITYTPRNKLLQKKGFNASYTVSRDNTHTLPKTAATTATTATAAATPATLTRNKAGTFSFRFNPMQAVTTDFSYTFGGTTPAMRLNFSYTVNPKLSFNGAWNSSRTASVLNAATGSFLGAARNQSLTVGMKYRLTSLTALDVAFDRKSNAGGAPGSNYSGYSLKATLSAEFSGI